MKEVADISANGDSGSAATCHRLRELLDAAGQAPLSSGQLERFSAYLSLILRWNARMNLTAIRSEEGILSRHFVESIACARAIPEGVRTLLDFGSGAGFPGIPIAICRPEISVTLAESKEKKAAFLEEAIRKLRIPGSVYHGRASEIASVFDCVTLRAVDKMEEAVSSARCLLSRNGVLALMTTEAEFPRLQEAAGPRYKWNEPIKTPGGQALFLALGRLTESAA
jgi:16S rRNA (guanine527-N7)-methyltransferase